MKPNATSIFVQLEWASLAVFRKLFFHLIVEGIQFKRFGEEIISGAFLAELFFRDMCGEHNDGDVLGLLVCFQAFADGSPIFLGELHIQENEIGKFTRLYLPKFSSSGTDANIISFKRECQVHELQYI